MGKHRQTSVPEIFWLPNDKARGPTPTCFVKSVAIVPDIASLPAVNLVCMNQNGGLGKVASTYTVQIRGGNSSAEGAVPENWLYWNWPALMLVKFFIISSVPEMEL